MGMSYRNIVSSGVLNDIETKYDVDFLTLENSTLEDILKNKGKQVISVKIGFVSKVIRRLCSPVEKLQLYSFFHKHNTDTLKKYIKRDEEKKFFKFYYKLSKLIGSHYNDYSFMSGHYSYFLPKSIINKIKEYDSVLILSSDDPLDKSILKIAKNNNIHSVLLIHSWDNLPARGYFSAVPDKVLVWNEMMKDQAIALHGIPRGKIEVIGVPQFYGYKKLESRVNEELFKHFYGLNENCNVITYTCSASRVFPDEPIFIQKLIESIEKKDIYIILRLHPTERKEEYLNLFSNVNKVIIDQPNGNFAATITNNIKDDDDDLLKFISLMKYSGIVINLASTTTLDAIIFNTPVICVSFNLDSYVNDNAWNSASNWYRSSHYGYIVNSGAIKVARNMNEFLLYVDDYLSDSTIDEENREILSREFCNIHYDVNNTMARAFYD